MMTLLLLSNDARQSTIPPAAAKSVAEIGVSKINMEPTHALAWFFVGAQTSYLEAALSYVLGSVYSVMAVRARALQGALGSILTSYANLARAATSWRLASSGGRKNLTNMEAAIMATVPTPALPKIFTFLIQNSPRLSSDRASMYPHFLHYCQYRGPSPRQPAWLVTGVYVPHPEQGGGSMNQSTLSRLEALLEQFAEALEQTDLCRKDRAQFCALLDALRIEVGLCREVPA